MAKTVNERIKKERTFRKITQLQMAQRLGMSRTNYAHMEAKGNPRPETLKQIAAIFNVSVDYLISDTETLNRLNREEQSAKKSLLMNDYGKGYNPLQKRVPFVATNKEQELLNMLREMPIDERDRVYDEALRKYSEYKSRHIK